MAFFALFLFTLVQVLVQGKAGVPFRKRYFSALLIFFPEEYLRTGKRPEYLRIGKRSLLQTSMPLSGGLKFLFCLSDVSSWANASAECGGESQSPIDIDTSILELHPFLPDFVFTGYDAPPADAQYTLTNDGHVGKRNGQKRKPLHACQKVYPAHFAMPFGALSLPKMTPTCSKFLLRAGCEEHYLRHWSRMKKGCTLHKGSIEIVLISRN